jgi:uncharacterized membrane protein
MQQTPPKSNYEKGTFTHFSESTLMMIATEIVEAHRSGQIDLSTMPAALSLAKQYYTVTTKLSFSTIKKEDTKRKFPTVVRDHDAHCNTKYYEE